MIFSLFCSYNNALGIIFEVNTSLKDARVFFHMTLSQRVCLQFASKKKKRKEISCSFITSMLRTLITYSVSTSERDEELKWSWLAFEYNSTLSSMTLGKSLSLSVPPSLNGYTTTHIIELLSEWNKQMHVYFHILYKQYISISYIRL